MNCTPSKLREAAGDSPAKAVPVSLLADVQRDSGSPAGPLRSLPRARTVGDAGREGKSAARALAEVRSRTGQGRGNRNSGADQRQAAQPDRRLPADAAEELSAKRALADEKVKAAIAGKQIVKVIVVPGKLVNIVVR